MGIDQLRQVEKTDYSIVLFRMMAMNEYNLEKQTDTFFSIQITGNLYTKAVTKTEMLYKLYIYVSF